MPLQSPLPASLPKECAKAAQIFTSFASIIPGDILRNAKGFAILVIAKAGFLFSARAGSGVVLVKLADGSWSAPSAIGTGGLGVGGQAGAELSEFVIILNSRAAVQSFMSPGSVNLGGNLSVAVGPLGRNAEATGSLNKFATMYSYSRTKGLFGGASLEGSVIFERGDANAKAYAGYLDDRNDPYDDEYDGGKSARNQVSARSLLSGQVPPPPWASTLINSIERRVGTAVEANWINDEPEDMDDRRNRGYSFDTEYAARSSDYTDREFGSSGSGFGKSKSPKNKLAASAKGRLRGYSLGSFGRKGSSKEESYNQRSRSNTTSGPAYRYNHDSDEDDDDPEGRETRYRDIDQDNIFDTADPSYAEREREKDRATGFSNSDYDLPPSPSSTTSNRSQRLSEFMKRPVMPARKSTTSARDIRGGGSPLGGLSRTASTRAKATLSRFGKSGSGSNSNSNNHSPTNEYPHSRARDYFDGERRRGRENDEGEEDEDGYRGEETTASPFADRFSPVTESAFDFDRFRAAGSTENSRASSPANGGSRDRATPTRQGKKKPSLLGAATSVLSRPLGKRAATAPLPRSRYAEDRENDAGMDYPRRTNHDDTDEEAGERDYFEFQQRQQRNTASHPGAAQEARRYSDDEDDDNDSDARTAPIAIHRNPFEDSGAQSASTSAGPRDLLTAHDDEVLSSSLSDVEIPRHRLEALYLKDNHDTRSIRSIDSNTEFTFGDKAHKMVSNDYSAVGNGSPSANSQKQYRMGTFDFDGAEAGDLSFKTGEVIEILAMDDPDWYLGKIGNRQGIIPVNRTRAYKG